MEFYSYHIFYFPFKWEIPGEKKKLFSEQVDLDHIHVSENLMWKRVQIDDSKRCTSVTKEQEELFGERQYYFDFVHPVLYDIKGVENSIIHHYERREPKEGIVEYVIEVGPKTYILRLDALNLNLYSTGVGVMSFFLSNEKESQSDENSIRDINQFGRRIMPPHSGEFDSRGLLAKSIAIKGLHGDSRYIDTFDYVREQGNPTRRGFEHVWEPAVFIKSLVEDLSPSLKVTPVIDDRMLVNCWYGNNDFSEDIKKTDSRGGVPFVDKDFWYKYVFVDNGDGAGDVTCQNMRMKEKLLDVSTYYRWQQFGTLYGISRYSLVALTDAQWFGKNVLAMHMRTIYSRMFELVIVQRASMLRFSGEVTKVSALKGKNKKEISERIGSLYKEYIRFVNQIYFRSVTAQDQGIELYEMLLKQFDSDAQIKDLDEEISELHQYITLMIDQRRSENGDWLNWVAAAFLPASLLTGIFGMNAFDDDTLLSSGGLVIQIPIIIIISLILFYILRKNRR